MAAEVKNRLFENIDLYEAFCLAITIDEERRQFYSDLSEKTKDPWPKNELNFLSDEEEKRSRYFQKRLEELKKVGKDTNVAAACDPERKLFRFVEEEIIKPFAEAREGETLQNGSKALALGRDLQKKTIRFYEELSAHEEDPVQAEELNEILTVEKSFLARLNYIMSY